MKLTYLTFFLALATCGPLAGYAAAQNYPAPAMTEAQKRKTLLPYIRAATNCVARATLAQPNVVTLYQQGKLSDAIYATGGSCTAEVTAMAQAHDQLYGAGTGGAFFKGPYVADLPRAVLKRVKGELDKRVAEVERAAAVQRAETVKAEAAHRVAVENADKAREMLRDRMYECTTKQVVGLLRSSESAEVLATAAMTICRKEIDEAIEQTVRANNLRFNTGLTTEVIRPSLLETVRKNVVTTAVQAKATGGAPNTSAPASPPAAQPASPSTASLSGTIVTECLKTVSGVQKGKVQDRDTRIKTMLDLCRPEIETVARKNFLASSGKTIDEARSEVAALALKDARTIAGPEPTP